VGLLIFYKCGIIMIQRRKFLVSVATAGAVAVAGCSGDNEGSGGEGESGDNDSPLDVEPEGLLPEANLFGDGWDEQDNGSGGSLSPIELDGETAKASFVTDGGQQGVSVEVTVFDSVDGATSGYEDMRDADSSDESVEDVDIASEGYLFGAFDTVYFRDANVIGMLSHVSDTSSTKPVEYGSDWHRTWRE
jgi:hypothetical protein